MVPQASVVKKGIAPNIDSYSAFYDNKKLGHTELESIVRSHNVTDTYICGIATDVCVGKSTTQDFVHTEHARVADGGLICLRSCVHAVLCICRSYIVVALLQIAWLWTKHASPNRCSN